MQKTPNILLIFTDQQRWDTIGAYGNTIIKTPNLDRMARQGAVFENAMTPCPLCLPARSCTITGYAAGKLGSMVNDEPAEVFNTDSLPALLSKEGYYCKAIGKMHFSNDPYSRDYGMDSMELSEEMRGVRLATNGSKIVYDDYDRYLIEKNMWGWEKPTEIGYNEIKPLINGLPKENHVTQWCGDRTVSWLKNERPCDKPFFLWTSFVKPHVPYDCPSHLVDLYKPEDMPKPWVSKEDGTSKNPAIPLKRRNMEFDLYSEEANRRAKAYYYANITFIDEQIGRIFQTLKDEGLDKDTLVVFTSDHGDMMGDHGLWYKSYGYEGSVHVPMLAWWPGTIEAGLRCKEITSLLDIFPTFAHCAGVKDFKERPGEDLLSLLDMNNIEEKDMDFSEIFYPPNYLLHVKSKKWKYLFHQNGGYEELYDLQADPHELKDLSEQPDYNDVKNILKKAAIEWIKKYSNPDFALDEEGNLRVENLELNKGVDDWSSSPRPFSRMPWDSRIPAEALDNKQKGWFWKAIDGDWSTVLEYAVDREKKD